MKVDELLTKAKDGLETKGRQAQVPRRGTGLTDERP
jgi:hypothetical protein